MCTLLGRRKKPEDARGVNFSCGPFFFAARTHGLTCRRSSPTRSRMPTCLGRWSVPLAGDCIWSTRRRVAWPGTTNSVGWSSGMRKRQIFYPFVSRQLSYLTHIYCSRCHLVASGLFGKISPRPVYRRHVRRNYRCLLRVKSGHLAKFQFGKGKRPPRFCLPEIR